MRAPLLRSVTAEQRTAVALGVVAVAVVVGVSVAPSTVPFTALNVPLLIGAVVLGPRSLTWLVLLVMVMLGIAAFLQDDYTVRIVASLVVLSTLSVVVLVLSLRQRSLGMGRGRGESMLVDLRDRILAQGAIPALPDSWLVQSALRSAGGSPFAGDFVVATTADGGRRFDVAVVDVSGKGEAAGTRALQLSGAMGGLLGALTPHQFLPAANDYLLSRDWDEGFATAVHLSLDVDTGHYELRLAGHPPPAHRLAGSGRWQVLRPEGPVLGLLHGVVYEPLRGRLDPGDLLLLYTDGMVEQPRRDIELGLDQMLGVAEHLSRRSVDGLAERLTAAVGSPDDDRALLLVHRR